MTTRALPRRDFLLAATSLGGLAKAAAPGLNVLFFAVDDLRPQTGCYGDPIARTPHIDALAARGLTFERAYCQQAVCSPSRTSLLTGRRPDTTRVYELQTHFRRNLPDVVTLPEQFKKHGYQTTGLSKIFHGGLDDNQSWSVPSWTPASPPWGSPENAAAVERRQEKLKASDWRLPRTSTRPGSRGPAWEAPEVADNELPDGKTADTAVQALRKLQGRPFFLAVGFLKPHLPFVAPKRYFDLYPPEKIRLAPNPFAPEGAPPIALHNFGELRNYRDIPAQGPVSDEKARELIRAYYAAMSYMDAQVGRVLGELDHLGLRRNTVVILWGDHGYHLGEQGLWNKHTNFENAVRSPLIISVPGQKRPGAKTAALAEFVDIYPSLCEICGIPLPEGLEGTSFRPLLEHPTRRWKKAAFSQYPRTAPGGEPVMGYSLRTDRYRFTEWVGQKKEFHAAELYDHEKDPRETVNLAGRPEHAALVQQLQGMLRAGWRDARPN